MNNLTNDQQKISEQLLNLVMQKVYTRIAPALTEEDMTRIKELNEQDTTGNSVRYFLLSKVPNFDAIFQEEVSLLKSKIDSQKK